MRGLNGKVAIVTGGARGIGAAITKRLYEEGLYITIADILVEESEKLAKTLDGSGNRILVYKTDITNFDDVKKMVSTTIEKFGHVDILVNNAGWDKIILFKDTTPDFWEKVIRINYIGQLNTCKALIDHFIQRKSGKIINIASDAGRVGSTGEVVYSGAKGAVIAYTKSLARELARFNVTCNVIAPGLTETPLVSSMKEESELGKKILDGMEKYIPLGRVGKPEDIAGVVAFFASDDASFITGQVLSVSGGLTMCG